jgi:hypothetical protein
MSAKGGNRDKPTGTVPISADLLRQREYVSDLAVKKFDFGLVLAKAFVQGMRDIGYKSNATAVNELIDNSIQAEATKVHVAFGFPKSSNAKPDKLAVIDNGHGMDPIMIRAAVLWGGTHRHDDRTGFGRYGYGLPSASVSFGKKFTVFSKVPDGNEWYQVTISLPAIEDHFLRGGGGPVIAPEPTVATIPSWVQEYIDHNGLALNHGSIVVIEEIDRLQHKNAQKLKEFFLQSFGITYRNFLRQVQVWVDGKEVEAIDPLFLTPGFRFYDVDDDRAEELPPLTVEIKDKDSKEIVGLVKVRFSYMPPTFLRVTDDKMKERGKNNARFPIRKENNGIIVLRKGRQIDVVNANCPWTTFQNNDRYIGIEFDFDPTLDEEFSITTSKQQIGVSERMWEILKDRGVYNAIKEMRTRWDKATKALKVEPEAAAATPRPSEAAMEEAQKALTRVPTEVTAERQREAEENLDKEVKARAKQSGVPAEQIKRDYEAQAQGRPFKVEFVDHAGAPFYHIAQVGGQTVQYINRAHRFYAEVYASNDATPHSRAALEVLLFVLGDCELRANDAIREFYLSEKAEWSKYLSLALGSLSKWRNFEDESASAAEHVEADAVHAQSRKG